MIGVIVSFEYDHQLDRERVLGVAERAAPSFEGMPGLRLKAFTVDDANNRAFNFYVWEDENAAHGFFTEELRERVTGLYGAAPRIDFVEIAALVENTAAAVG